MEDERENLTNALAHLETAPVTTSIQEDFLQNPVLQKPRTWKSIWEEYETRFGKNHHCLRLVCDNCGNSQTCRCSTPKTTEHGICPECAKEAKNDSHFLKRAAFDVTIGEAGLKNSWQKAFEPETKCKWCGDTARIGFVVFEKPDSSDGVYVPRGTDKKFVSDLHDNDPEGEGYWLHDCCAVAVYFCKECLEPSAIYNQA